MHSRGITAIAFLSRWIHQIKFIDDLKPEIGCFYQCHENRLCLTLSQRLHPARSASSNLQSHALSKEILQGCLEFLPKEYASDMTKTHSRINRARARGSTDDRLLKERPIVFFGRSKFPFSLTGAVKSAFTWANFCLKGLLIFSANALLNVCWFS